MYAERLAAPPAAEVTLRSIDQAGLAELTSACDPAEVDEAGTRSRSLEGLVAGYLDGRDVAAAGSVSWPGGLGHIGVLSVPGFRGRGIGTTVAHTAANAIIAGLMPQWRAASQNVASIRTGLRVGFVELGRQLSVKVLNDRV